MAISNATIRIYARDLTPADDDGTITDKLLPSPVKISTTEEIIWSANTGRSITPQESAVMMGDVVAQKKTFNIEWGVLTQTEYNNIVNWLGAGFKPFTVVLGTQYIRIASYRGTITAELLGSPDGRVYYRNAQVSIIQR